MCGLFNSALPIIGAIAGNFLLPGLGTGIGAMIGGAVGGAAGGYLNTHSLGGTLLGGVTGGVGGYFGGPSMANGLGSLFSSGTTSALGELGATAAANGVTDLGGLEAASGGAALFGPSAGTGTAMGSAANALGGQGLGIAGGDALSGVAGNTDFMGGLGGGYGGTGLGVGTNLGSSQSGLNGISVAANPNSPTSVMANTNFNGPSPTTNTAGMASGETSQAPSPMGNTLGAQPTQAAGNVLEGNQAVNPGSDVGAALQGGQQGGSNLSTMYGPNSTAASSPMGQGIAGSGGGLGQNVQAGALGEAAKTGMDASDLTGMFNNAAPWMRLANAGYGAYQNYQQQQAQKAYMDQINSQFAPNSPYAQQMQETLARQDAAQGRNSQYGTRAVQLAAALTQARAQALGNSNYYRAASQPGGLATMFNPFFAIFGSPQGMQALGQIGSAGFNGLSSLFGA